MVEKKQRKFIPEGTVETIGTKGWKLINTSEITGENDLVKTNDILAHSLTPQAPVFIVSGISAFSEGGFL